MSKATKGTKRSRRQFIKDAALAAGAAAVGGFLLTGCSDGTTDNGEEITWDKVTDVIVVGTGCGLAAAIEAKTAGADVLVLERNDWAGGLYITTGGHPS